ncbi:uncharacterized protein AKAW2_81046A [Aspergillus luchuensis]|uniref:Uncharacterized protein n=1 Tax=Aspergillus kawachii TaxID=1069201 RepID=A0A7R8A5L4_ASPKA|nr:uncharacterized protein AKAW2_81046A [Aspergillus luchuensis]BCS05245.1 hypothetical protein AKAW2_81046A [Aspergillus luchuensis]
MSSSLLPSSAFSESEISALLSMESSSSSSPPAADGDCFVPLTLRRPLALDDRFVCFPLSPEALIFLSCWCGATFLVTAFLVEAVERGPALQARLDAGVPALGVPGPRDDCRRLDEAAGSVPSEALRRRRLFSTAPAEDSRCCRWKWIVPEGVAGAELRAAVGEFRASAAAFRPRELSFWVAPNMTLAFAEVPLRGEGKEEFSTVKSGKKILGGSRYWSLLLKREGIGGSFESMPLLCSLWMAMSSFLICRSSRTHAFSLSWIFSSCSCCDLSRFCIMALPYCSSFGLGVKLPFKRMNFWRLVSRELMVVRHSWMILSLAWISSIRWLISAGRFATSWTKSSKTAAGSS